MIFEVLAEDIGARLDALLAKYADISRSAAERAISEGRVAVCGAECDKKHRVKLGDIIEYTEQVAEEYEAKPENIPLDVIYEDGDIIVINKPSGMVVHPAPGNPNGTLVNALLHHCRGSLSGIGGVMRPGIVHRIDKDTSGLIVCAKNDFAHKALSEELAYHGIEREYHALTQGGFPSPCGTVNMPIGRHPIDRKRMAVLRGTSSHAKEAITHYELIRSYSLGSMKISYLMLRLETGRTHQIRVHMSSIGHPLLGDSVYGGGGTAFEKRHASLISGQVLHAKRLTLTHPRTGERMCFECELPKDFAALLEILNTKDEQ